MPTDPQAEVLVIGRVPVQSILYVAFRNTFEKSEVERHLPRHLTSRARFEVDLRLFKPRHDWKYWQQSQMGISEDAGVDFDDDIPF